MEYENLFENFKGSENFWTKNKRYDFFPLSGKDSDRVSGLKNNPPLIIIPSRVFSDLPTPSPLQKTGKKQGFSIVSALKNRKK